MSDSAAIQPCRGCGVLFPYSPDADFCDECAAENAGDTREGCYRVYYRTDDGREGSRCGKEQQ